MDTIINVFLHINLYLESFVQHYGAWVYPLLFTIIFCETGLVFMPFLPGDSLLFAAGALAALGDLNVHTLAISLMIAAILGNLLNYWIGRIIGPKVFQSEQSRFFNKKHIMKTHAFYENHGGKAIIIGRFLPIIRTFVPFIAGIGKMNLNKFIGFSVAGSILWICLFTYASYYFGSIPAVKQNFSLIITAIIIISVLPALIEVMRQKHVSAKEKRGQANDEI